MQREIEMEIATCLDGLDSTDVRVRREAASKLADLGVWTRGSVRPRGRLDEAVGNRLPVPGTIAELIRHLGDSDPEVRRNTSAAAGEWGGDETAEALGSQLASEKDEETRLYLVGGLRAIGGRAAVRGLAVAVAQPSEAVREAAIEGIADLVSGGATDDTEDPLSVIPVKERETKDRTVSGRGPLKTRGGAHRAPSDDASSIAVNALKGVLTDTQASVYLRQRAAWVADRIGRL